MNLTASLATALAFHQLFEGLALGVRIAPLPGGPFRFLLVIAFALALPLGALLGALLSAGGDSHAAWAGAAQAASGGMLVYAGAVEMLGGDFVFAREQPRPARRWAALACVGAGATAMALLGYVCGRDSESDPS